MRSRNLKRDSAPSPDGDALLQIKEYAWAAFNQLWGGTPEEFEQLWGAAFGELLKIETGDDLTPPSNNEPHSV